MDFSSSSSSYQTQIHQVHDSSIKTKFWHIRNRTKKHLSDSKISIVKWINEWQSQLSFTLHLCVPDFDAATHHTYHFSRCNLGNSLGQEIAKVCELVSDVLTGHVLNGWTFRCFFSLRQTKICSERQTLGAMINSNLQTVHMHCSKPKDKKHEIALYTCPWKLHLWCPYNCQLLQFLQNVTDQIYTSFIINTDCFSLQCHLVNQHGCRIIIQLPVVPYSWQHLQSSSPVGTCQQKEQGKQTAWTRSSGKLERPEKQMMMKIKTMFLFECILVLDSKTVSFFQNMAYLFRVFDEHYRVKKKLLWHSWVPQQFELTFLHPHLNILLYMW